MEKAVESFCFAQTTYQYCPTNPTLPPPPPPAPYKPWLAPLPTNLTLPSFPTNLSINYNISNDFFINVPFKPWKVILL